ncbi:hypothetical protein [Sinorhizobium meliloti]|uniref:hypothetical protein n=1 Tax=Rhizobium meliloti TaxID=382 RepID=UPI000FDC6E54|nr:hypothetical protein [Sinorhizobium meliloti]RVK16958.1 hypothetical protein CN164_03345 [Sinorhizobium meliloti]
MTKSLLEDGILPGLPNDLIRAQYVAAPGNEFESGKFLSEESSACLAANTFGFFLDKPATIPSFPIEGDNFWPPHSVRLEVENRFPWSGGRHSWLDAVVETQSLVLGIESKRYEPFRSKRKVELSEAYWRPVWGEQMERYCRLRDDLRSNAVDFHRLDVAQLIKHAFGLRTRVHRDSGAHGKKPLLLYLYAEPISWPDGRLIPAAQIAAHRNEISLFAERVAGDEVSFAALSYRELLNAWRNSKDMNVRAHADVIMATFKP